MTKHDDLEHQVLQRAIEKLDDLRLLLDEVRLMRSQAEDDAALRSGRFPTSAESWARTIIAASSRAPSYLELMVAQAICSTEGDLNAAASNLTREFERALTDSEVDLTRLLRTHFFAGKDEAYRRRNAKRRSSYFRKSRKKKRTPMTYALNDVRERQRFIERHERCILHGANVDDSLMLRVVDVLASDGDTVLHELESLRALVFGSNDVFFENVIARIIMQSWAPHLGDELRAIFEDIDKDELRKRDLYVWVRIVREPAQELAPGTVYGNWICSTPYPVGEHACRRIRRRLWRGEDVEEVLVHDVFFGMCGEPSDSKIYLNAPLDASELGQFMREVHKRMVAVHQGHWATGYPDDDDPDVLDLSFIGG